MLEDLSPERQQLAEEIAAEAERQLAEIYMSSESQGVAAARGIDDRPVRDRLARQFATVREILNRDVEDVLYEIVPKLGICHEDHPIYRAFEESDKLAKAPLAGHLIGLIGVVFPTAGATALIAALVVIFRFSLDEFCDRLRPDC